jgi:hypothetical protein
MTTTSCHPRARAPRPGHIAGGGFPGDGALGRQWTGGRRREPAARDARGESSRYASSGASCGSRTRPAPWRRSCASHSRARSRISGGRSSQAIEGTVTGQEARPPRRPRRPPYRRPSGPPVVDPGIRTYASGEPSLPGLSGEPDRSPGHRVQCPLALSRQRGAAAQAEVAELAAVASRRVSMVFGSARPRWKSRTRACGMGTRGCANGWPRRRPWWPAPTSSSPSRESAGQRHPTARRAAGPGRHAQPANRRAAEWARQPQPAGRRPGEPARRPHPAVAGAAEVTSAFERARARASSGPSVRGSCRGEFRAMSSRLIFVVLGSRRSWWFVVARARGR